MKILIGENNIILFRKNKYKFLIGVIGKLEQGFVLLFIVVSRYQDIY